MLQFQWNSTKASENLAKHGVSFDEAVTVFYDDYATQFFDHDHSDDEERFVMLGMSIRVRVLVVSHCERHGGEVIRIISARKATARERLSYQGLS